MSSHIFMPTPCHRNPIYTDPYGVKANGARYTDAEREAAAAACLQCPILQRCARDALLAGTSLDGHRTRAAVGVIQAGVLCDGDGRDPFTTSPLADIGGCGVPVYQDTTPRVEPPSRCVSCGRPMVGWTRGEVPAGMVMHHGRGYCQGCRAEYVAEVRANPRQSRNLQGRERGVSFALVEEHGDVVGVEQLALF